MSFYKLILSLFLTIPLKQAVKTQSLGTIPIYFKENIMMTVILKPILSCIFFKLKTRLKTLIITNFDITV